MAVPVYVIVRNRRRADPSNFKTKKESELRLNSMVSHFKSLDPDFKEVFKIIKTSNPHFLR